MPEAREVTRTRHVPGDQAKENETAHQESVSPEAQQSRLIAVQMNPEQDTANALAMRTKSCQILPDPSSIFDSHHVNGHGETYILSMSKRAEVAPF